MTAYRAALEVYTREAAPDRWLFLQKQLQNTYVGLNDWEAVARVGFEVFGQGFDDNEVFSLTGSALHEKRYRFEDAYSLIRSWAGSHPDDISARADLVECSLTTGRFGDAVRLAPDLLAADGLGTSTKLAVQAQRVAALVGDGKRDEAPSGLATIKRMVSEEPSGFNVTWEFAGTRHFISNSPVFGSSRTQLLKLFDALEGKDRDTILAGIDQIDVTALAQ